MAECAEAFQMLGFTEYEARVYVTLLQVQPATAYEVSKLSGLQKANVYGVFEALTKKAAVQPVSENPVRYVAVDPKELLQRIADETNARCTSLATKLQAVKRPDDTQYVWSIAGQQSIAARIDEMIASAERHVWIKAPEHIIDRHLPALKTAAGRGVKILLIVFGDAAALARFRFGPAGRVYLHENNGIEVGHGRHLVTLTIDFKEALTVNTAGEGYGAHTRNRPVVNLAESLIRHEIYVAEIFSRFGAEIEACFGPALLELRQQYLPADQVEALKRELAARERQKPTKSRRSRT